MGEMGGVEPGGGTGSISGGQAAPVSPQQGSQPQGGQPQGTGDNPAWADLLNILPTQLHGVVKPQLQKWDQGVQQKFQQVHSEYEPWKGLIDAGLSPDDVQYAVSIMNVINEDPQKLYDTLGEYLGISNGANSEQGGADDSEGSDDEYTDPRIQELEQGYQNLAQIALAQHQEREEAEADAELDNYLGQLKEQYGEYDEQYVLALMASGADGEQAVQQFQQLVEQAKVQQNRPPAPTIMGPGGGLPSQQINPSELNGKGRRELVANMLKGAAEQNRL